MKKLMAALLVLFGFIYANAQLDSFTQYLVNYKFPAGSEMTSVEITLQDGGLYGTSNMGSAAFTRVNKDTFSIPAYNGIVYFSRNSDNKVNRIHIEVSNVILDGIKDGAALAWINR